MQPHIITRIASTIVALSGVLWGFYWLPVRGLSDMALPGAWGTAAITMAAVVILFPLAVARRHTLARASPLALGAVALGGIAFTLYSTGFVYGRVAIIILLYFLTPVWSVLIGKYVMGWPTPRLRILAIFLGLIGLLVMLSGQAGMPLPRGPGEWMALLAGFLWSIATTGIRAKPDLQPGQAAFVFACAAMVSAIILAPMLEPLDVSAVSFWPAVGLATLTGAIWWVFMIAALMWATARLDPARVGILLMTEVLVGAASAAYFAGEKLYPAELAGGALVLCAAALEVWPVRRPT